VLQRRQITKAKEHDRTTAGPTERTKVLDTLRKSRYAFAGGTQSGVGAGEPPLRLVQRCITIAAAPGGASGSDAFSYLVHQTHH
jgi:hypothetical protein